MTRVCIAFAGVVGSSKTPIATYLSGKLNLAIHNNDAIRTEVLEDCGVFVEEEYLKRRDARIRNILEKQTSFILDASVDRQWPQLKELLRKYGYRFFLISLDLSKDRLIHLYEIKEYTESLQRLDQLFAEHGAFLQAYENDIGLHVSDQDFRERLEICYRKASDWLREVD